MLRMVLPFAKHVEKLWALARRAPLQRPRSCYFSMPPLVNGNTSSIEIPQLRGFWRSGRGTGKAL